MLLNHADTVIDSDGCYYYLFKQMIFLIPVDVSLIENSSPDTSTEVSAIIIEISICRLIIYSGCSCCCS